MTAKRFFLWLGKLFMLTVTLCAMVYGAVIFLFAFGDTESFFGSIFLCSTLIFVPALYLGFLVWLSRAGLFDKEEYSALGIGKKIAAVLKLLIPLIITAMVIVRTI